MKLKSWSRSGMEELGGQLKRLKCQIYIVQERRFQWYDHMMRRDEECVRKRVLAMEELGRRSKEKKTEAKVDELRERRPTDEAFRERGGGLCHA